MAASVSESRLRSPSRPNRGRRRRPAIRPSRDTPRRCRPTTSWPVTTNNFPRSRDSKPAFAVAFAVAVWAAAAVGAGALEATDTPSLRRGYRIAVVVWGVVDRPCVVAVVECDWNASEGRIELGGGTSGDFAYEGRDWAADGALTAGTTEPRRIAVGGPDNHAAPKSVNRKNIELWKLNFSAHKSRSRDENRMRKNCLSMKMGENAFRCTLFGWHIRYVVKIYRRYRDTICEKISILSISNDMWSFKIIMSMTVPMSNFCIWYHPFHTYCKYAM